MRHARLKRPCSSEFSVVGNLQFEQRRAQRFAVGAEGVVEQDERGESAGPGDVTRLYVLAVEDISRSQRARL